MEMEIFKKWNHQQWNQKEMNIAKVKMELS